MFEYQTLFDARGGLYNRANRLYSEACAKEPSVAFLRDLFGLAAATSDAEILDALRDLGAGPSDVSYRIPWCMNYVSGDSP